MRESWQKMLEPNQQLREEARHLWETATGESAVVARNLAEREAEGAKLHAQLDAICGVLPKLEVDKNLAKKSRSFKEAGRIAEEIKRREEEKKSAEAALEKLQDDLSSCREALAACRQHEDLAQEALLAAEAK